MSRIEDGGAVEAGLVAWLEGAATYFEKRPTNDEDRAHWANVFNAENCRAAAAEITRLRAEVEEQAGIISKLVTAFDAEIHNEFDGTSMLAERLSEIDFARAARGPAE